jgi:uncharacterized protein
MKKLVVAPFFLLFLILFDISCKSPSSKAKLEYYPNGNIKKIQTSMNNEKQSKEILFKENGNIQSITNYADSMKAGEQLNFFEEKGTLKSKLLFNQNKADGVAYWFYESGSLKSSRNYIEDNQSYLGFDYWDDSFVINKALVKFDRNGKLYYKMNFDSSGKPLNEEGKER